MWRLPRPILVFWFVGLDALVSKILFLITIVIGNLSQVFVLPFWWPAAVLVIPSQRIKSVDSNSWGEAWRSWAAKATITTASSITPIIFMIFPRLVRGMGVLGVLRRLGSRFLRFKRVLVGNLFFDAFVHLKGGLMASRTASIHFSDPERKVEGGFGLRGNGFFNGLLLGVFSIAILLGLGTDRWPEAVAE